jgi:hypothetical protein
MLRGGRRSRNSRGSPRAPKCAGQEDPISQDPIDEHYAIRLLENGHYFCHDIRELHRLFNSDLKNRFQNPVTRQPWSEANKAKIRRKFAKLALSPVASPLPSPVDEYDEESQPNFRFLDALLLTRQTLFPKIVLLNTGIQLQRVFPYENIKYDYDRMGDEFQAILSVSPYLMSAYMVIYVKSNDWFIRVRNHIQEKSGQAGHADNDEAHFWPWSPVIHQN